MQNQADPGESSNAVNKTDEIISSANSSSSEDQLAGDSLFSAYSFEQLLSSTLAAILAFILAWKCLLITSHDEKHESSPKTAKNEPAVIEPQINIWEQGTISLPPERQNGNRPCLSNGAIVDDEAYISSKRTVTSSFARPLTLCKSIVSLPGDNSSLNKKPYVTGSKTAATSNDMDHNDVHEEISNNNIDDQCTSPPTTGKIASLQQAEPASLLANKLQYEPYRLTNADMDCTKATSTLAETSFSYLYNGQKCSFGHEMSKIIMVNNNRIIINNNNNNNISRNDINNSTTSVANGDNGCTDLSEKSIVNKPLSDNIKKDDLLLSKSKFTGSCLAYDKEANFSELPTFNNGEFYCSDQDADAIINGVKRFFDENENHISVLNSIEENLSLIPTYLDTISEENSDDLVSYGRTSSRISPLSLELENLEGNYLNNPDNSSRNVSSISSCLLDETLNDNLFSSTITITDKTLICQEETTSVAGDQNKSSKSANSDSRQNSRTSEQRFESSISQTGFKDNFIEPYGVFKNSDGFYSSNDNINTTTTTNSKNSTTVVCNSTVSSVLLASRRQGQKLGKLEVIQYPESKNESKLKSQQSIDSLEDKKKVCSINETFNGFEERFPVIADKIGRFSGGDSTEPKEIRENLSKSGCCSEEEFQDSLAPGSSYLEQYDHIPIDLFTCDDIRSQTSSGDRMTEYDLRKANRRFERYRSVYKDAQKSGVEEFNEVKPVCGHMAHGSDSSFSSQKKAGSSSSLAEDIYEMLKHKKSGVTSGKVLSSSEKIYEVTLKRDKNGNLIEESNRKSEETGRYLSSSSPVSHNEPRSISAGGSSGLSLLQNNTVQNSSNSAPNANSIYRQTFDKSGTQDFNLTTVISDKAPGVSQISSSKYVPNVPSSSDGKHSGTNINLGGGRVKKLAQKVNAKKLLLSEIRQQKPPDSNRSQIARLSDVYSDWSFSSDSELETTSYHIDMPISNHHRSTSSHVIADPKGQIVTSKSSGRRLVMATATSKAVINDPAGKKMTSLIAAASANAVSDNPYVALAQATADAASKVSQVVDMTIADPTKRGKVSLVVSSTVCAAGRDLSRCSRENITYSSTALNEVGAAPRANMDEQEESSSSESIVSSPPASKKMNIDEATSSENKFSSSIYETLRQKKEKVPQKDQTAFQGTHKSTIGPQYAGSERLLKLIQKPTEKPIEKSTGSQKDDKHQPVLNQRNLSLWSNLPENSPDSQQHLMRWKNSVNLTDNKELKNLMTKDQEKENAIQSRTPDSTLNAKAPSSIVKDMREQYMKSVEELNDEIKIIRRNRYKAKIDKAKKEYLESKASISDLYKNAEEFQKKFNVSIENIRLPEAPRGPYLEFLGKNGSLHSLKASDIKPIYHDPADSLFDREYERIVRQAEKLWAPYKKRSMSSLSKANDHLIDSTFYGKGLSTGCLETTFDADNQRFLHETDLDHVFMQIDQDADGDSRGRLKNLAQVKRKAKGQQDAVVENPESRTRARSVDYLADQKAREEIAPPENQLKKILGDESQSKDISEHEIRFMKSADKLQTPDWYIQSDYYDPSGKQPADSSSYKSSPPYADGYKPTSTGHDYQPSYSGNVDRGRYSALGFPPSRESASPAPTFDEIMSSAFGGAKVSRPPSSVSRPSEHTRYVSPWTYSGKVVPPPVVGSSTFSDKDPEYMRPVKINLLRYDTSPTSTGLQEPPIATTIRNTRPLIPASRSGLLRQTETTTTTVSQHFEEISTTTKKTIENRRKDDPTTSEDFGSSKYQRQERTERRDFCPSGKQPADSSSHKSSPPYADGYKPTSTSHDRVIYDPIGKTVPREPEPRRVTVKAQDKPTSASASSSSSSPIKIPNNFFDKYKDEIEQMRKSRANLNVASTSDQKPVSPLKSAAPVIARVPSYGQNNIPIATVRPSSFSQPITLPGPSPSKTFQQIPTTTQNSNYGTLPTTQNSNYGTLTTTQNSNYGTLTRDQKITQAPAIQKPLQNGHSNVQNGDKKSVQISEQIVDTIRYERHDDSFDSANRTNKSFDSNESFDPKRMDGWTVSDVPANWNLPGMRRSVVIEVSDSYFDSENDTGKRKRTIGATGTLEEVLDKLLNLPTYGQKKISELHESSSSLNNLSQVYEKQINNGKPTKPSGYGIYANDSALMSECRKHPDRAEELLEEETLWVSCSNCDKVRHISDARSRYVSCHYCYTYYCGRSCRKHDWNSHKEKRCNFARISTLCKGVIVKTRLDSEAQWQMSKVARQGYSNRGRGSVNFRFNSPFLARKYIDNGWEGLTAYPSSYLNFFTVDEMVAAKKDPNLIKLCRLYDADQKFILSVSIIAEIEDVPETPLSERKKMAVDDNNNAKGGAEEDVHGQIRRFERSRSVPSNKRKDMKSNAQKSKNENAKSVLRSILRSVENIAPGPVYISAAQRNAPYGPISPQPSVAQIPPTSDQEAPMAFERNTKQRSTALGIERPRRQENQSSYQNEHQSRGNVLPNGRGARWKPCSVYGESDIDETEV